jgi:hypothetical protein
MENPVKPEYERERLIDIFRRTCCAAWTREDIARDKLLRFAQAYLMMARAKYRPAAPSDGFGNIQLTKDECNDRERLVVGSFEMPQLALRYLRWLRQAGVLAFAAFFSFCPTVEGKAFGYDGANVPHEFHCSAPSECVVINNICVKPERVVDIANRFGYGGSQHRERRNLDLRGRFICCENVARQRNYNTRCSLVREFGSDNRALTDSSDDGGRSATVLESIRKVDSAPWQFCRRASNNKIGEPRSRRERGLRPSG